MGGWLIIFLMIPGMLAAEFVEVTMDLGSGLGALAGFLGLLAWWSLLVYVVLQLIFMVII